MYINKQINFNFLVPKHHNHSKDCGRLVVKGFNATLTAKVISWRSVMHMCFLAFSYQYKHNFSFQSHRLLFSHASAEVRGIDTSERKVPSTGYRTQPPGPESDTLTTEPPGRGPKDCEMELNIKGFDLWYEKLSHPRPD